MVSKNNYSMKERQRAQSTKQRFALRKLTVGVASVLLGTTYMGLNSMAHADTLAPQATDNMPTGQVTNSGNPTLQEQTVTLNTQSATENAQTLSEQKSELPTPNDGTNQPAEAPAD